MIRLPKSIDYEEVPLEKRYRAATRSLSARIGALYGRAVEEFGDDALDLIRSVSLEHARDLAKELCGDNPQHDAKSATLCLAHLLGLVGMEVEAMEISPQRARIRIRQCLYRITRPELCQARLALESEFIRTLNADLTFEIEQCAARGDEACVFRIALQHRRLRR
ncbi:MAG: hypothetical protein KAW17_09315 [Candidatus Eisenbacteria sp.]|nr:hypothetical protein [Candidatus Eisenbacteria bacterium]